MNREFKPGSNDKRHPPHVHAFRASARGDLKMPTESRAPRIAIAFATTVLTSGVSKTSRRDGHVMQAEQRALNQQGNGSNREILG